MNSYFKPPRRKIGVATLVVTCVLMALWIRSRTTFDCVMINSEDSTFGVIYSVESSLRWTRLSKNESSQELHFVGPYWSSADVSDQPQLLSSPEIAWKWRQFGFGVAKDRENLKRLGPVPYWSTCNPITVISGWVIPYWSIAIPLTMLSAWLLLSKLRAKTLKKDLA